jgi:flagellar biosynthetic protein FliR
VEELARLAGELDLDGHLVAGMLVLARVGPLVSLVPFFGGQSLSPAVRLVVAAAITLAIYPAVPTSGLELGSTGMVALLLLREVLVGAALGFLASLAFHALAMAGELVDLARGSTSSRVLEPASGEEQSPLATLHFQLGVVLFLIMGGHRAFLAVLVGSYGTVPLVGPVPSPSGVGALALLAAELTAGAIAAALLLSAPAVLAVFLTDLAFGVVGRTAPQLGTYFMAMPLRAFVGLAMVLLALGALLPDLAPFVGAAVTAVRRAIPLLGASPG